MKRECEDILQVTRKSAEKHFQELIKLYETARGKSEMLEKQVSILQQKNKNKQEKTLELANLLETLAQFNVNVESVCQIVAEGAFQLKHDCVYVEKMRKLRQLTWEEKENNNKFSEQEQLRLQNSILKEIVKSLKKKKETQEKFQKLQIKYSGTEQIPEKDESPKQIKSLNFRDCNLPNLPNVVEEGKKSISQSNQKINFLPEPMRMDTIIQNSNNIERNTKTMKNRSKISKQNSRNVEKSSIIPHMEIFQSHYNGIPYEEYIFKFSRNEEMKVKFLLAVNDLPLKIQFTDDEAEYEDASMDKIYIFLRNIEKIVKMKNCGLNCAVQTARVKLVDNYSQTKLTNSSNSFSRLNVGATVKENNFDKFKNIDNNNI
ncbi:SWI5-dependent HO expression protein 3-like, partial [Leptopilina heterotoma]|uniref:SWI5-dependent HO expression protein 3-like n=1 Tax=Leptopilina heterotoma TaxID=63436 RepID=UPI001CA89E3C